ncbi:hypothetical protein SFRURICE_015367 [Spodoptera frugiperda]|nr:hypothetical protein SFRURICE_015367 [Spodoptera frugiperda]
MRKMTHVESDSQQDEEKAPDSNNKFKNISAGRFLTMHKRRKKRLITRSLYIEKALLDDLSIGQVQCILNNSYKWKFNAFTLENVSGGRCLPVLCVHLFQMYGLLAHFNLDAAKAWKLFSLIEEGYHSTNPYHNSIHAADVTQAMHCFLQQKRIRDHLTPLEIMGSLLAAIAHDLDHPGVNQPFLIATSNHLAALYKNTSVLENHHWRSAMSCLIESGLLDQLPSSLGLRAALEKQISSLILATDITRQQEYLNHFKVSFYFYFVGILKNVPSLRYSKLPCLAIASLALIAYYIVFAMVTIKSSLTTCIFRDSHVTFTLNAYSCLRLPGYNCSRTFLKYGKNSTINFDGCSSDAHVF